MPSYNFSFQGTLRVNPTMFHQNYVHKPFSMMFEEKVFVVELCRKNDSGMLNTDYEKGIFAECCPSCDSPRLVASLGFCWYFSKGCLLL